MLCAGLTVAVPASRVQAAANAMLDAEETNAAASLTTEIAGYAVSLSGFHCGAIAMARAAEEEFSEPDYIEMPLKVGLEITIGVEFLNDVVGATPRAGGNRPGQDDGPAGEAIGPLSARLKRIMVEDGGQSLTDSGAMEDVSLSEASMSVADLVGRCLP